MRREKPEWAYRAPAINRVKTHHDINLNNIKRPEEIIGAFDLILVTDQKGEIFV